MTAQNVSTAKGLTLTPSAGGGPLSLVRLLPEWFHAIADYAVAAAVILVPIVAGGSAKAVAADIVVGGVVALVSMLTRYPLGV